MAELPTGVRGHTYTVSTMITIFFWGGKLGILGEEVYAPQIP